MKVPLPRDQILTIFAFHPSIRFVTVVSKEGRLLDAVTHTGMQSLEPPAETAKILQRWALSKGMLSGADDYFGRVKSVIVNREKLVEMLFPLSDQMVIISARPGFPIKNTPRLEKLLNRLQSEG